MDSTPIDAVIEERSERGLIEMAARALYNVNYKSYIFLFVLFVLVTSDTFSGTILRNFSGAVINGVVAPYGVAIQGTLLVVCYIILNFLIEHSIL